MAQLAYNISNELLSCKICFCQFSREKLPKLLSCPHTFCEPCLKKMVRRTRHTAGFTTGGQASGAWDGAPPAGQVDNITCPVCRELTTLKEHGVHGLANNLTILTLMDMITTPGLATSPTRNRLESPEEGMGRCVQCNKRYPESQFLCGHCICDRCLEHYLRAFGHNDQCPVCKPAPRVRGHSRSPTPDAPPVGACSPGAGCRPKQITPVPAPRFQQRHTNATGPEEPPLKPSSSDDDYPTARHSHAPARPPPFNPTYAQTHGGGASASFSSSPEIRETCTASPRRAERSVSPYAVGAAGGAAGGEPRRYHRGFTDPDNISLCSVASESRLSPRRSAAATAGGNSSPGSTLRRTQSMRRPPPPPQRKYGTLQRHTLAPPQPAIITRSAENVREPMAAASNSAGRQRHSLSESSGGPQCPPAPAGISPPVPPPRRIFKNQTQSPTRCVKKFGSYSEVSMQTSCFRRPSRLAVSEKGDIVVADSRNMTIQVFSLAGDYLAMFKVLGVQDACFITVDKLCVASHMGVHIYTTTGQKITDIHIGATVAVAPYMFGFIAATPKSLHIYRQSFTLVKEITKFKSTTSKKWSPIHKKTQMEFHSIRDIAVTPNKNICVLDGVSSSWTVHILTEDGHSSAHIDPGSLSCGAFSDPGAIATDLSNHVYVSDTEQHRVLRFTCTGVYQRCVVAFSGRDPNTRKVFPRGVAVTETGHVIVGITGDQVAEVRVYNQVS